MTSGKASRSNTHRRSTTNGAGLDRWPYGPCALVLGVSPSTSGADSSVRCDPVASLPVTTLQAIELRLRTPESLGDFWGTGPRISEHDRAGAIGTDDHRPLVNQRVARGGTTTNQGVVGSNPASRTSQTRSSCDVDKGVHRKSKSPCAAANSQSGQTATVYVPCMSSRRSSCGASRRSPG
jgi:hypothetical protein